MGVMLKGEDANSVKLGENQVMNGGCHLAKGDLGPGRLFICCTATEDAAAVDNERPIAPLAVTLRLGIRLSRHPLLFRLLSE